MQLQATPQDLTYCYTYAPDSCYDWQQEAIANGTAEICHWIFVDANSTKLFPDVIAKCRAGGNGTGSWNGTAPGNGSNYLPEFEGGASGLARGGFSITSIVGLVVLAIVMM